MKKLSTRTNRENLKKVFNRYVDFEKWFKSRFDKLPDANKLPQLKDKREHLIEDLRCLNAEIHKLEILQEQYITAMQTEFRIRKI